MSAPETGAEHGPASRPPLRDALRLPDGTWIRGRGLRRPPPEGPAPDFGLYLGSSRLRSRHAGALSWPHEWIDWPDFLLPRDRDQAVRHIRALYERARAGESAEVACGGGVGRTGTVIACLAVLAGHDPAGAVAWTREHHHHRAVETPWQRRWVSRFPAG
ncbi:protein-tyrosine phosphatase family protein [Actinomadura sp. 9N407]|uniref:phosphatase domain-containing protein n=1 Tax=Actinomadura sp. 9N407 TaxID=3375154 RepID=UPI0037A117DA